MARSTSTKTAASIVVAFALIIVLAAFAAVSAGGSPAPSRSPDPSPTPVTTPQPSAEPTASPTVTPSPAPSDPLGDGIVLDIADDHEVVVVIANASDTVVGARSGVAAEGMSVRWGDVQVENIDEDTLRLTWSSWLQDETVTVAVAAENGRLLITMTQKLPYPNTDAMGGDRVLEIDLAQPFDADDVRTEVVAAE